mgnify:CR=1 FL=1
MIPYNVTEFVKFSLFGMWKIPKVEGDKRESQERVILR